MMKTQYIAFLEELETTQDDSMIEEISIKLYHYLSFLNIDLSKLFERSIKEALDKFKGEIKKNALKTYTSFLRRGVIVFMKDLLNDGIMTHLIYTPWEDDYYSIKDDLRNYTNFYIDIVVNLNLSAFENNLISELFHCILSNISKSFPNRFDYQNYIKEALLYHYSNIKKFPSSIGQLKYDLQNTNLGHYINFIEFKFDCPIGINEIFTILTYVITELIQKNKKRNKKARKETKIDKKYIILYENYT